MHPGIGSGTGPELVARGCGDLYERDSGGFWG